MRLSNALRTVALIEAAKGLLVLLAGFGLLSLVHRDVEQIAEHLISRAHLNPAAHYPHIFLDFAQRVTDGRLMLLAAGAAGYSLVRLIEAYGLWHERRWAEWFAALSGGFYIPFEIYELVERVTWLRVLTLTVNVAVVSFMLYCVLRGRAKSSATSA
jgi:uncharacterized membrane protein (DUF2068 family)